MGGGEEQGFQMMMMLMIIIIQMTIIACDHDRADCRQQSHARTRATIMAACACEASRGKRWRVAYRYVNESSEIMSHHCVNYIAMFLTLFCT